MKTIILRHRREYLPKCSLRGLEGRGDLDFYTYPKARLPDLTGYILLKVGAPPLTKDDAGKGLLLIDGTWRLAQIMEKMLPLKLEVRSLPIRIKTAYPRRSTFCSNPDEGLASVEALYLAHYILGLQTEGLLDHYYWKDQFLNGFSHSEQTSLSTI
jgi:pre-rRNA-processing protein TSR3